MATADDTNLSLGGVNSADLEDMLSQTGSLLDMDRMMMEQNGGGGGGVLLGHPLPGQGLLHHQTPPQMMPGAANNPQVIPQPARANPTLNQLQQPKVEISEQPKARGQRFRYKCEGRSAGSIPGEHSTNEHRSYPTIQIHNYSGPAAIVVVSCVTKDEVPRPHPHALVGQDCNKGVCTIKLRGTTSVSFPNIGIQCATKREVQEALKQREKIRVDPFGTGYFQNVGNLDLNVVRLCFQVFLPDEKSKFTRIVPPVVSQPIYDKKAVNDLVICRLSKQAGSAKGGDEVFMLCEKVNKDDIQVRFFEMGNSDVVWEDYGDFAPSDVHRQYALVFKTPKYKDPFIKGPAQVYVQLKRPSDDEVSDAKPFQYIPDDPDPEGIHAKRRRKAMNFGNFFHDQPGVLPAEVKEENEPKAAPLTVKQRLKIKASRNSKKAPQGLPAAEGSSNQMSGIPNYTFDNTGAQLGMAVGGANPQLQQLQQLAQPVSMAQQDMVVQQGDNTFAILQSATTSAGASSTISSATPLQLQDITDPHMLSFLKDLNVGEVNMASTMTGLGITVEGDTNLEQNNSLNLGSLSFPSGLDADMAGDLMRGLGSLGAEETVQMPDGSQPPSTSTQ